MKAAGGTLFVALSALLLSGCYTKFQRVGDPALTPPVPLSRYISGVGVIQNQDSFAPDTSSLSSTTVVERLVARLVDEGIFEPVVFPYSGLADLRPPLILDVTVRIEEKLYWGENITKAVLHGLSLFLLAPVLPNRFGLVVDISADAMPRGGSPLANYAFTSEYDLEYSSPMPSREKIDEWVVATTDAAVDDIVNQIKADEFRLRQGLSTPE